MTNKRGLYLIRYAGGSAAIVDEQCALDASRLFRRQNHPSFRGERAIAGIIPFEDSDPAERAGAALPASAVVHCVAFGGRMIKHEWQGDHCTHCGRTMTDWILDDLAVWSQRTHADILIEMARRDAGGAVDAV